MCAERVSYCEADDTDSIGRTVKALHMLLQVERRSAGVLLCRLVGELPEPAIRRVSYKQTPRVRQC